MNIIAKLEQEMAGLSQFSTGEHTLEASAGGVSLSCRLVALDTLACAFSTLSVHSPALAARTGEQLKKLAESLAVKLNYLLEPIRPIEYDADVVQLRSNPPQKTPDRTTYYELLVAKRGELMLTRYARPAGQAREIIPAQVTREVLLRLAGDLASAAS
jgi:hypothetical protein